MQKETRALSNTSNYLSLTFEEFCNPQIVDAHIRTTAEKQILNEVSIAATPSLRAALQGAQIAVVKKQYVLKLAKDLPRGAKLLKDTAGNLLPTIVGKNGKFLSTPRVIQAGVARAKVAACAPIILLEASHYISGHDQIKLLRRTEAKVDQLLEERKQERRSKLEAIYRKVKEIVESGQPLSDSDKSLLSSFDMTLMELRSQWQAGFLNEISKIEPVKLSFWQRTTSRQNKKKEKLIQQNHNTVARVEQELENIYLMQTSLKLQMVTSHYTGRIEAFKSHTMQDELTNWQNLSKETTKLARKISKPCGTYKPWGNVLATVRSFEKTWNKQAKALKLEP